MDLLVRTPKPKPTESLLGYVLRVSESNGYEISYVWQLAQIPRGRELAGGFPVSRLARILGQDLQDLRRISYRDEGTDSRQFKILGHSLGETLRSVPLRLRSPAFCPLCVEEHGYIDAFWDLTVATACPVHRLESVFSCSACGKSLSWRRPAMLECGCGAMLTDSTRPSTNAAVCDLMEVIRSRLHRKPLEKLASAAKLPVEYLKDLPLASLLQIVDALGTQLVAAKTNTTRHDSTIAEAAEALTDWPNGYHRALVRIGPKEDVSSSGLRSQFRMFYETMFKNRVFAADAAFLRDEFLRFGQQHWDNVLIDGKLLRGKSAGGESRYLSRSDFARRFRLWKPTMERLVRDGTIVMKAIPAGRQKRVVVDVQRSRLPADSKGMIRAREAARRLGLPVRVIECLRRKSVIGTEPRRGHARSWHINDVDSFLMRARALAAVREASDDTVRLHELMDLKLRDAEAKADIVAAVFDGRLIARGRAGEDVGDLLLDKMQVDSFVLQKRRIVEGDTYSLPESAALTGLDPGVVACAIDIGLLTTQEQRGRLRVTAASVEAFNAEYIPLSKIAANFGTSVSRLLRECHEQRIPVVTLRRIGGGSSQPIVRRGSRLFEELEHRLSEGQRKSKEESADPSPIVVLQEYLEGLRKQKLPLPKRGTSPNKRAIAKACGFDRNVFYKCMQVANLLATFTSGEIPPVEPPKQ